MTEHIALVTGGNRGIGFEIVQELASAGWTVILTARRETSGKEAQAVLNVKGVKADFQAMDVTEPATIRQAADWVAQRYGRLDVLINNAGIYLDEDAPVSQVSPDTIRKTLETNTLGPLQVTQAFLPLLRKGRDPQVINVSSGYGQLNDMEGGAPAAYKLSKAALNVITIMLADELKQDGIAVNSVCPGWVRTEMGGPNASRSVEEGASGIVSLAMKGRQAPTRSFMRDLHPIAW